VSWWILGKKNVMEDMEGKQSKTIFPPRLYGQGSLKDISDKPFFKATS